MPAPTTALLVLDAQKAYTMDGTDLHCRNAAATIEKINRVIGRFVEAGAPTFLVRHVYRADGSDLGAMYAQMGEPHPEEFRFRAGTRDVEYAGELEVPESATEVVKNRYSAFENTDLEARLRIAGIDSVAVTGFMTSFCCESTARDAHDKDFLVTFLPDATGCPDLTELRQEEIRGVVGTLLGAGLATVLDTEQYLDQDARTG